MKSMVTATFVILSIHQKKKNVECYEKGGEELFHLNFVIQKFNLLFFPLSFSLSSQI